MYDRPMIRYNHPGDLNTWFVQAKEDKVPVWAVNVEDYDPSDDCRVGRMYDAIGKVLCNWSGHAYYGN